MLSKSQARLFFLAATLGFSGVFPWLTVDTIRQVPERSNEDALTAEVIRGKEIWEANNCMGCHTLLGEGAYYAPELTLAYKRRGEAWLKLFLKDPQAMYPGRRKMVQYDFTDAQIEDVIAFLKWVGEIDTNGFPREPDMALVATASAAPPPPETSTASAPAIFTTICVACHALGGAGGNVGPALDGDEIDLAALVAARADLAAGREPGPRLYIRRERDRRDLATTVLLDVSLSTDAWVENRRVLDVAHEAVLVLGEVADRLGDRLQVLAFASQTRNRVRVWEVRGWDEPWRVGRGRLGRLAPQGYTRIGPALRHATAELNRSGARQRLLLLVSDGKPTDYDRYEDRYGIADVRRAIGEARETGICARGLAVDAVARDYLPAMMGPGAWSVLPHPGRLPEALTTAYGRLS